MNNSEGRREGNLFASAGVALVAAVARSSSSFWRKFRVSWRVPPHVIAERDGDISENESSDDEYEYDDDSSDEELLDLPEMLDRIRLNDKRFTEFYYFGDEPITRAEMESFALHVRQNTHIKDICLDNIFQDYPDLFLPFVEKVLQAPNPHPSLKMLYIGYNNLGNAHAAAIGRTLLTNRFLETLFITNNHIGNEGVQALVEGLMDNASLKYLGLDSNQFGEVGFQALGSLLKRNSTLTDLGLSKIIMTQASVQALSAGLEANTHLVSLELGGCFANNPDAIFSLTKSVLPGHASLKHLKLARNNLGDRHATCIGRGLSKNKCLETLMLSVNSIGNKGAQGLSDGLCHNGSLKELFLINNSNIGEVGFEALASSLHHLNFSLKKLVLCIGNDGINSPEHERKINNLCSFYSRRVKKTFSNFRKEQLTLSCNLWPRALEKISHKPDFIYSMIRLNPQVLLQRNSRALRELIDARCCLAQFPVSFADKKLPLEYYR